PGRRWRDAQRGQRRSQVDVRDDHAVAGQLRRNSVKTATVLAVALLAPMMTASAQRIVPAAVVRPAAVYVRPTPGPMDSIRPLSFHMKRGAGYGAATGVVLSGLVLFAIAQEDPPCCEAPTTSLTAARTLGVLALGTASGIAVGSFLGFTYHFQLVEQ